MTQQTYTGSNAVKTVCSVKWLLKFYFLILAKLLTRANSVFSFRYSPLSLFPASLFFVVTCFAYPVTSGEDKPSDDWKQIWSFTISKQLDKESWGKFLGQPGIAILPDGQTYLREGKIYDFATNKPLNETASSKKDAESTDKDNEGPFSFRPAGKRPEEPKK